MFILGLSIFVASVSSAQTVVIDSLDSSGRLTATVPSNAVYSVEWIGSLDSTNGWQPSWSYLRDVKSEDGSVDVEVPMFFRLTCLTNGALVNAPVGRTYHYSITNQAHEAWNKYVSVMGDTYMPQQSNSYRTIWSEEWYNAPDEIPAGAQLRGVTFMRADEDNAYILDSEFSPGPMTEDPIWKNGPVGTTWSYQSSTPHTLITAEILATNETVTIGTTNYTGCIKIESVGTPESWLAEYPDPRYYEWILPGGYVVKTENYWVHESETNAAPVVYELQGWEDL
jgi:hypothetical protein